MTKAERIIEQIRIAVFRERVPYRVIAERTGLSTTTIGNIARGKTKWPRPNTFFALLDEGNLEIKIGEKRWP